jgi:tetratricopeptide (TPR) repeat protein
VTARELLDRASAQIDARFGDRPLTAAAIHHTLGGAYAELGVLDEAESHLARAVELRRAHAGADAADTLRSEIAAASLRARRNPDARAESELRALAQRAREHLGRDEPLLYSALNDLGFVLLALDRAREAVAVLEEARVNRVRLLGPHHREELITTGNLASAHGALGDTRKSLEVLLAALEIAESMPDAQRGTLLGIANNIGATYQDLGEDAKAAPYLRRAAELAGQALGPRHPDTLTIEANVAGLEADLGEPEKAAEMFRSVVAKLEEVAGPTAESTLTARYGLANALWKAKRNDEAAAAFAELLDAVGESLGDTHWLAGQTRVSLARALLEAGRAQEALPHAELGAAQLRESLGPDHARTRGANEILAAIQQRLSTSSAR